MSTHEYLHSELQCEKGDTDNVIRASKPKQTYIYTNKYGAPRWPLIYK